MARKPGIGNAEADVLRFIADRQGATATEVGDYLLRTKGQTRSTALSMMERLRRKGFLVREKVDGVYRYSPVGNKTSVLEGLVNDFVDGVLGGSIHPLVAYLTQRVEVPASEIEELRALVRRLEGTEDAS